MHESRKSEPTSLSKGNEALRNGDYSKAITCYAKVIVKQPSLAKSVSVNLSLARKKYRASRHAIVKPSVAVCGWDLAHNAAGRAYTLASIYETFAQVEMIGSLFPSFGREIWEPIRDTEIVKHTFLVKDESKFIEQAIELVAAHPFDIVHLSKPRAPNIFFGVLYKLLWGSKVLMDIDDEELAFVGAETPISIDNYIEQHGKLPDLKNLGGNDWTRLAVGLVKEFDGLTVCNAFLQQRYGGEIIRHARDESLFNPSPELKRRSRERYGIPQAEKVVLFFGTPQEHKGLIATAQAIASLNRPDIIYFIVGSFPDEKLKQRLLDIKGCKYKFLPNQPISKLEEILSTADCCVLQQDVETVVSNFQTPAKLTDALAMGLTVLVSGTAGMREAIKCRSVAEVNATTLANELQRIIFSENLRDDYFKHARKHFLSHFSLASNLQPLKAALQAAGCNASSTDLGKFQLEKLTCFELISTPIKTPRIIIYSCNFGGYEVVRPPLFVDPRVTYVLFTDDPKITSDKWNVIMLKHDLDDPRRASRLAKLLPHKYLPAHDISVYIDSSMELIEADVLAMVRVCMEGGDIALYKHAKRSCIYDEIDFVQKTSRKVSPLKLASYLEKLRKDGYPTHNGLFENGIIFRRNTPAIRKLNEMWWHVYETGPERDQFSLCYCLWRLGISVTDIKAGKQVRVNPFIKFHQHEYVKVIPRAEAQLYVFIAYAPRTYDMNLGRCYNDYMEMVEDDNAYVLFIDHDAVLLHPSWRQIVQEVMQKHLNETALFIVHTNRINNPYQRLNLLENNHQLTDNTQYAKFIGDEFGASTTECAKWPSSSGVVLMLKKSTWRTHKFSDGFLKVDNNIHISLRTDGDKVYLMNGLYAYHFYRADNDFSHAVRAVPNSGNKSNACVQTGAHTIRNFVLCTASIEEIDRYMRLLQPNQNAIFIHSRAMFCNKDWYTLIEQTLSTSSDIGVMVFNGNDKDYRAPFGSNVLDHRNYTRSLAVRCDTLESLHDFEAASLSRAFMFSKRVWSEYLTARRESDEFSLAELFRVATKLKIRSVAMNHIYVLDADIDHGPALVQSRSQGRKRVAILTMGFWPALAGMEMMIHNLATKLTEAGDLVVLFTPKPKIEFVEIPHSYLLIRFPDLETMKKKFREFHATMPFDIIFVQGAYEPTSVALELKREFGLPVVLRTHGEDIQIDEDIGYGYRMHPEKNKVITSNIREVNHNVVIGPHILPEIKKITGRDDVTLIYNGVDIDHFSVCKSKRISDVFKLHHSTKVLLMVGRNIKKKTLHLALDALAILKLSIPDVVLVHVGKTGNGENLREYAERLGISDSFHEMGIVSYFDMPTIYNSADIFVFPSKIETFGNVTMEAMACGLPCVEFDYIVNREKIIDSQTGYILPHGDVGAMAQALADLLDDPSKCAQFAAAARQRAVTVFSWWSVCEQYRRLFTNVINKSY
jgi:glycosyltransferase involved in cell wall biosynthesis